MSLTKCLIVLLLFFALVQTNEYIFENQYSSKDGYQTQQHGLGISSCSKSHYTAFETVDTNISFSTSSLDSFVTPKIQPLNSTAGEQWAFDGTSDSGQAGLLIGFYRDPNYAFLGPGSLRLSLDVVWENSTTYSLVDYLDHSTVVGCDQVVIGVWAKRDHSYTFEIAQDYSYAKVEFETPSVKGWFMIDSIAPAHYPDGTLYPSQNASTWNAPLLHWNEPIPAGRITVDMIIDGTPFQWKGIGGHDRWWSAYGWLDVMAGWQALRAVVGPYTLSYWAPTSRIDSGVLYPSAFLTKDGQRIFATQSMTMSETEDYFLYEPKFDGTVRGNLKNRATGYRVQFVSPSTSELWNFDLEHKNMEFEFKLGSGDGGSAFVGLASGGEENEEPYDGVFFNEHVDISNLKVPAVYVSAAKWFYRAKAAVFG